MDSKELMGILDSAKKKLLVYHSDIDGVSSAVLMLKFFEGFDRIPREGPFMDGSFMRELSASAPDVIVFLDIPIDQEWEKLELLQKKLPDTRVIVIDHHIPEKNLNSPKNIHINPRFRKNVYLPASYLVYRLLEQMGKKVQPLIWLAAIGVIGDYGFEDCGDLLRECEKLYPGTLGKDPFKSKLRDLSDFILSSFILEGLDGVEKSVRMLLRMKAHGEVEKNPYFSSCNKKIAGEMTKILKDYENRKRENEQLGLIFYRVDSRLNLASTISTIIAEKNPDKVIIIEKYSAQWVKISARCQAGDVNLNLVMKEASSGIGSGGGHEKAAGAMVLRKDLAEFEKRVAEKIFSIRS